MTHSIKRLCRLAALVAWAAAPLAAQDPAPAPAPQPLVVTAENLMAGDARHQELAKRGQDSATVLAGDVIRYRLRFTNVTERPVERVVFNNPLPPGLRYVGGSARADRDDVTIDFSIDGGQSYAARPMIEVEVDGKRERRPAPPELYTHVRWTVRGAVAPGAQVIAEFRAQFPADGSAAEPSGPTSSPRSGR